MEWTAEEINRISKLVLTAADQLYGPIWQGQMLAPLNNLGTSALQPYDTPGGFFVSKTIDDTTTGFRLAFYKNSDTHELLVIPNGSDGWTLKDWASNGLYTGWNQWKNRSEEVMSAIRDAVSKDPDAKIYIGGQSLGGALAQFVLVSLLQDRQKPTITVTDPVTLLPEEVANPLYNFDLSKVTLDTFASPGVGDVLHTYFPDMNLNDPEIQQMLIRHYTTQGELVNMVGGAMVGGDGKVYYLPTDGSGDVGYLHRIPAGIWDGTRAILADFAGLSATTRATLSTGNLQSIGTSIALLGANGQMTDTEAATRLGLALVIGSALSPPGEMARLVSSVASRYMDPSAGAALGFGVELLSKALLLTNPLGWVQLVMAGLGISNLAHLGASTVSADDLIAAGFIATVAGATRLPPIVTKMPDGQDVTVVVDQSPGVVFYQIKLPDGRFWRSTVSAQGEQATSSDGFEIFWPSDKPYGIVSYTDDAGVAHRVATVYPDQLTQLTDGPDIVIQARTPLQQNFEIRYTPPAPGQNEVGIYVDGKQALLDSDFQSLSFNSGTGLERYSTWQGGLNVLDYMTGGDRYLQSLAEAGFVDSSQTLLRRVVTDADGKVLENEVKSVFQDKDGQWKVDTNSTSYKVVTVNGVAQEQLLLRIQERSFEKIQPDASMYRYDEQNVFDGKGNRTALIQTVQDGAGVVQNITALIGHDVVQLKYAGTASGSLELTEVTSINGVAPSDPAAALVAVKQLGVDADQFELVADNGVSVAQSSGLGDVLLRYKQESGMQTLIKGFATYAPTVIDALSLIRAIQTGQPLPIVASGLRLATDFSSVSDSYYYNLSGASNVASGILSLMSLDAALKQGDTLAAITAGTQAISFGAQAYANFAFEQVFNGSTELIDSAWAAQGVSNSIGQALPYINLVNSIAHGDTTGAAVAVVDIALINAGIYSIPYIGWAYAIYSIVDSLFSDTPSIPDPWGTGRYVWDGTGISIQSAGETGGNEAVANVMNSVLSTMNALVAQVQQQNPGSQVGLIPNRMPTLGYDMSGYRYTDIDPLSGAEQHPALRFDTTGRPYNAAPGTPESYMSLGEAFVRSALARGAIAPLWEVQTAKMQTDAGDPKAGLTEEERAGRDGHLAPPASGATQTFRPVALDLDGDGIETIARNASNVSFDVEDSGYLEHTGWLKGDDAFLALDRNYNGQVDSGRELFSNGAVDISRRGLAGLAWVDANYDGKITSADPVWNELRIWQDANENGQQDAGETLSLNAVGITELNYSMGAFQQNGQAKQLASPDLEADTDGTRVSVVPEGILIQSSTTSTLSLLVNRIDDLTAVQTIRDGTLAVNEVLYFCERMAA
jgi:hypothetical protein